MRIAGTSIACDTGGTVNELVFLSHAGADRAAGRPLRGRSGRQQVLLTETTLALLGRHAERLRARALVAPYGRPFVLGDLRLELFPTGLLPGAAGLVCEAAGEHWLYAGAVTAGEPSFGALPPEVRPARAVCVHVPWTSPRVALPPRAEAIAAAVRFVEETLAAGGAPVLLAPPFGEALDVAAALTHQGHGLRGHRLVVAAASAYRKAGLKVPPVLRFSGHLAPGEVLLWAPEDRTAASLGQLRSPRCAWVGAAAVEASPAEAADARVIPLAVHADAAALTRFIENTHAEEVAVTGRGAEAFAEVWRARGWNAYAVTPPHQMPLFHG